jgi:hypothetical protein
MELHNLSFIPPDDLMEFFKNDYEVMLSEMMYGDVPSFDEMIAALISLQQKIQQEASSK